MVYVKIPNNNPCSFVKNIMLVIRYQVITIYIVGDTGIICPGNYFKI